MDQQELSTKQFGASAANYLTSPVHAGGEDPERLCAIANQCKPGRVLDLGCGGDASHVRDYRVSEWKARLGEAGFMDPATTTWTIAMEFNSWISRIGTPPARVSARRTVLAELPKEVRQRYRIDAELSFISDSALFETFNIE